MPPWRVPCPLSALEIGRTITRFVFRSSDLLLLAVTPATSRRIYPSSSLMQAYANQRAFEAEEHGALALVGLLVMRCDVRCHQLRSVVTIRDFGVFSFSSVPIMLVANAAF